MNYFYFGVNNFCQAEVFGQVNDFVQFRIYNRLVVTDYRKATDALKLLRSRLTTARTTFLLAFKERQSCNLKVIIPIPITIIASQQERFA